MKLSMSLCQQRSTPNVLGVPPPARPKLDLLNPMWPKEKIVIVMGATGTGKSRLSIDLATQFPAEIINSDKMQVYRGLDVVTNKVTEQERRGIPHHLLGVVNPDVDFTAKKFCDAASLVAQSILSRGLLPIIVGGSNSYIEALVDGDYGFRSNYEICFVWVDVKLPVLHDFVAERVDQMVKNGLVDEVRSIFNPLADYSRGIRKSIGVPELDKYLRSQRFVHKQGHDRLEEAVRDIKFNTCKLACRQLEKIHRLRNIKGWKIHRFDATQALCRHGSEADEAWERLVSQPSIALVTEFLYDFTMSKFPHVTNQAMSKDHFAQVLAI